MNNSKLFYFLIGMAAVVLYISNRLWPTQGAQLIDVFYTIVLLGGAGLLLFHGTLRRSRYARFVMLGAGAVITGLIFSLQKWKGADVIIIAGSAAMLIFYALHYFVKRSKTLLDHLKMSWLVLALSGLMFILFELPYAVIITDTVNIFLLIMLIFFVATQPGTSFTPRSRK